MRWRDADAKHRAKTFRLKADAEDFEGQQRAMRRSGYGSGNLTLGTFVREWWRLDIEPRLAESTKSYYRWLLATHILPRLGDAPLREITAQRVHAMQADMLAKDTGAVTTRKATVLLGQVLRSAVAWGHISTNPVDVVRKPPATRAHHVEPVSPAQIEGARAKLRAEGRIRDATLIALLGYTGMRPQEALALTWGDVREQTIRVNKRNSDGVIEPGTKSSSRAVRTVEMLEPLAVGMHEWKSVSDPSGPSALVFPRPDGEPWTKWDYGNWRGRRFRKVFPDMRVYDLRHSAASLMLAEGRNPVEVAAQLGHSPAVTLQVYAHILAEYRGKPPVSADKEIRYVRGLYASEAAA